MGPIVGTKYYFQIDDPTTEAYGKHCLWVLISTDHSLVLGWKCVRWIGEKPQWDNPENVGTSGLFAGTNLELWERPSKYGAGRNGGTRYGVIYNCGSPWMLQPGAGFDFLEGTIKRRAMYLANQLSDGMASFSELLLT
jgi:hypothetical protein